MSLKGIGFRLGLSYLLSRAKGTKKKEAVTDSLLGTVLSQADDKSTAKEITKDIVSHVIAGERAKDLATLSPLEASEEEINAFVTETENEEVGLTLGEAITETSELIDGIKSGLSAIQRLEQLKKGIIKRD